MSEEYSPTFSSFYPLTILAVGLLGWFGCQDYSLNNQRSYLTAQFQAAIPTIQAADGWHSRYNAMIQDLGQTGSKDPAVAAIAKEAIQAGVQAGLIHINQDSGTNGVTTPSTPASK